MHRRAGLILLTVVAVVFVGAMWGRGALADRSSWTDRYQPTRLEWLALRLQASYGSDCGNTSPRDSCIAIQYAPRPPDEILVLAAVFGPVQLSMWTDDIDTAKKLIASESKGLGMSRLPRITVMRREADKGGDFQPIRGE